MLLLTMFGKIMVSNYLTRYTDKNGLLIHTQNADFKKLGYEYKAMILHRWKPKPYFYHLRDGGHVQAVRKHIGNTYFARADLKKFFSHVQHKKVVRSLGKLGFSYEAARTIATHSTVKDSESNARTLPFGFVQSPILATLALHKSMLGNYLKKLDSHHSVTCTVYMDDILLSSNDKAELAAVLKDMLKSAEIANFPINAAKVLAPSVSAEIFNILLTSGDMEITTERMGQFFATLNNLPSDFVRNGISSYVASVNANQVALLPL